MTPEDDSAAQPELLPVLYPDAKPDWLARLGDIVDLDDGYRLRLDEDGHLRRVL